MMALAVGRRDGLAARQGGENWTLVHGSGHCFMRRPEDSYLDPRSIENSGFLSSFRCCYFTDFWGPSRPERASD